VQGWVYVISFITTGVCASSAVAAIVIDDDDVDDDDVGCT
jgi:hypothetical protein